VTILQARSLSGRAAVAFALALTMAGTGIAAAGATTAAAGAPRPGSAVMRAVSRPAQQAADRFWTPARMAAATPPSAASARQAPGTPSPVHFAGVPTVGALFFTTGTQQHFCTASVMISKPENLILTAAHCVYGSSYASKIVFVPKYHSGKQPYGVWPVRKITVAAGWRSSHNQNLDFAFLAVAPPAGTHRPVQRVTGGLRLGINIGYSHRIKVIGYNNTDDTPIRCATSSFKFAPHQMKFRCHNFQDGTSGGPWIIGYHGRAGTGTVFGVIGGYQQGGNFPWASYSAYFSGPARRLFRQAQGQ
jgi:V8-like Glu-specific endopeptidase